jgi:hypothetical protein
MTISTTQNQITYTGDAVTLAFSFPYPFITTADIKVYVDGAPVLVGFSVSGTAPVGGSGTFSSGTVTFVAAPANGADVLFFCDPDLLQSTSLPLNDPFPSKTVEKMADKLTLLIQRLKTAFGNAITFPPGENVSGLLPAAATRASKIVSFDADGNLQVVAPVEGTATALAIQLADTRSGPFWQRETRELPLKLPLVSLPQTTPISRAMFAAMAQPSTELPTTQQPGAMRCSSLNTAPTRLSTVAIHRHEGLGLSSPPLGIRC